MDLQNILFKRSLEHFERGLSTLEVAICELRFEIYKLKHPCYEEILLDEERRKDHEAIGF